MTAKFFFVDLAGS